MKGTGDKKKEGLGYTEIDGNHRESEARTTQCVGECVGTAVCAYPTRPGGSGV